MPSLSSHTSAAARRCLVVRLRRDPRPGVGLGQPTRGHQPGHPGRLVGVHHHDEVVGRAEVLLDQQRHVVHDDRLGGRLRDELGGPGPHERVGDLLEVGTGPGVAEHQRTERRPVQRTVGGEHLRPEAPPHLGEAGGAGRHDLTRDAVGVDDDRAELAQPGRDGGLARADAPGETDLQHGLRRPRGGPGSRRWPPAPSASA